MTFEVTLSISLNCSCVAGLSMPVEHTFHVVLKRVLREMLAGVLGCCFLKPAVALTLGSWTLCYWWSTSCPSKLGSPLQVWGCIWGAELKGQSTQLNRQIYITDTFHLPLWVSSLPDIFGIACPDSTSEIAASYENCWRWNLRIDLSTW